MNYSLCLAFLAILLTGISQVLLKYGARGGTKNASFLAPYLNVSTISAYGILLIITVISVLVLREIPLKIYYAIASLNLVVVVGLSWGVLKERVTKKMILGIVLIVLGIVVFNLPNY